MAGTVVGDVVERHNHPTSATPREGPQIHATSPNTGFPAVQHRLKAKSVFKRIRLDQPTASPNPAAGGILNSSRPGIDAQDANVIRKSSMATERSMEDIFRSNTKKVEEMTQEERLQERQDIIDHFGSGIGNLMKKAIEARERRATPQVVTAPQLPDPKVTSVQYSPSQSLHPSSARKIRFVEPTETDIHVYEPHPPSPKRSLALLPPPADTTERSTLSLGTFSEPLLRKKAPAESRTPSPDPVKGMSEPLEEGTPEDIRRRFFPSESAPEDNPALTWLLSPLASSSKPSLLSDVDNQKEKAKQSGNRPHVEARYSLSGLRLSSFQIENLPTHLGLHHHASTTWASDNPAGYTLPDLLLLARSSVPAQRASILGVLTKILKLSRSEVLEHGPKTSEFLPTSPEPDVDLIAIRRDVLDVAIDALGEKGSVGRRALDALWEAVVGFTLAELDITDLNELPSIDFTLGSSRSSSASSSSRFRLSSAVLIALPLARILPALKTHLITSASPLSLTHSQVLDILFILSHFSQHAHTIVDLEIGAGVIAAMLEPHLRSSFDSDSEEEQMRATPASIRVLQALARSGREVAITLVGPADVLLRYVAPLEPLDLTQWQHNETLTSLDLIKETLVFYTLLAQYGIYAIVATTAQNQFTRFGTWLSTTLRMVGHPIMTSLGRAYLDLLTALMICATNPHQTTPSHEILWSQVQGWGWVEWALDLADMIAASPQYMFPSSSVSPVTGQGHLIGLWTSIFHTVAAYVEGASVNGVKGGMQERTLALARLKPLLESGRTVGLILRSVLAKLQAWRFPCSSHVLLTEPFHNLAEAASLVLAVIRLSLVCFIPEQGYALELPVPEIHEACTRLLEDNATRRFFMYRDDMELPEHVHTFMRPVTTLLALELKWRQRSIILATKDDKMKAVRQTVDWVSHAVRVLHTLLPGDEHHAEWIIETLCDQIDTDLVQEVLSSTNLPGEQWDKGGIKILLPFLTRSLRPNGRGAESSVRQCQPVHIAPFLPTSESIAHSTTLRLRSLSHLQDAWQSYDPDLVLPIRSDWATWPVNHLLHSGSSPVFRNIPLGWDATETEVVRASLLLARIVQELSGTPNGTPNYSSNMSQTETVFACMKVFMLEHGQQQCDSGEEVFRDTIITQWMNELLAPFAYGKACLRSHHVVDHDSSLEQVSKGFLGSKTPFYQFYTDFLTLYDTISYSHPLFGRLLLPPVSMCYATDYRKLLFGDYGHLLRTIKTDVSDILCHDVREYLWPIEKDPHMIGWYLKTLLSPVCGFVRWMALHHVALNIWPGFRSENPGSLERASQLLHMVVTQGNKDVVRDVALYRQLADEAWMPPKCYEPNERGWIVPRLDFIDRMSDGCVKQQLHQLLLNCDGV